MRTSFIIVGFVLASALAAVNGCSSSTKALSLDGAARDAPTGTGGATGGGGAVIAGTGGSGGAEAGTGGAIADARVDTPLGTGGADANRDQTATGGAGGGVAGAGGRGGGGAIGSGGTAGAATGGATGQGGSGSGGRASGGTFASGGASATGGRTGAGGVVGSGGATGTGGTGIYCGDNNGCPANQFCDFQPVGCGVVFTDPPAGICKPTGSGVICTGEYAPVCGCDGKTYGNDCLRLAAGVLKAPNEMCNNVDGGTSSGCGYECRTVGGVTGWYLGSELACAAACTGCTATCSAISTKSEGCYASCGGGPGPGCGTGASNLIHYTNCSQPYAAAYLAWQAPGGSAGTGPAVVISAAGGWIRMWDRTEGFSPETPPESPTATSTLSETQTRDLFTRLAAVDLASLPHEPSLGWECYPRLYFRLCAGCTATTLNYDLPESISPEMESVWAWFDQITTSGLVNNPRYYCAMPKLDR